VTSRYYGETEELLGKYAWYSKNSLARGLLPGVPGKLGVGGDCLQPNDYGLFDMLGNALEWCQDRAALYEGEEDKEEKGDVEDRISRVLRGGSFYGLPGVARSAFRVGWAPTYRNVSVGFRPARSFH
jgi:formylglycine-generating enzyme required for sulfatase activity